MKIYSLFLSLVMLVTSIPAMAVVEQDPTDVKISVTEFRKLEKALEQEVDMDMPTFEARLDKTLSNLEVKAAKKIAHMSDKKAEKKYQTSKNLIMKHGSEGLKNEVANMDASNMSAKEKLQSLNSMPENRGLMKSQILKQVKAAGGLKQFLKNLKLTLKEKRAVSEDDVDLIIDAIGIIALIVVAVVFGPQAALALLVSYLVGYVIAIVITVVVLIIVIIIIADANNDLTNGPKDVNMNLHESLLQ